MKEILLGTIKANKNQGLVALVDDILFPILNEYKWHARNINGQLFYAGRNIKVDKGKYRIALLHRDVLALSNIPVPIDMEIDHINSNGLDCTLENLRVVTHAQNVFRRRKNVSNTSGFKGVTKSRCGKWIAQITSAKNYMYLGTFQLKEEAALAYNVAAKKLWGDYALLNEVT